MSTKQGDYVRAKRMGWDEKLTVEQSFDMETYEEHGYESDELEGVLRIVGSTVKVYLVNGQEADPKTIVKVA